MQGSVTTLATAMPRMPLAWVTNSKVKNIHYEPELQNCGVMEKRQEIQNEQHSCCLPCGRDSIRPRDSTVEVSTPLFILIPTGSVSGTLLHHVSLLVFPYFAQLYWRATFFFLTGLSSSTAQLTDRALCHKLCELIENCNTHNML